MSGDIGQMEADGTLKIIDRKKDLVRKDIIYLSMASDARCLHKCYCSPN